MIPCPHCNGPSYALGQMGRLLWYRCRNCGSEYAEEPDPAVGENDDET